MDPPPPKWTPPPSRGSPENGIVFWTEGGQKKVMKQSRLCFLPRVVMPENPRLGVAVLPPGEPVEDGNQAAMEAQPEVKKRRELSSVSRIEVLNYRRDHTENQTLAACMSHSAAGKCAFCP